MLSIGEVAKGQFITVHSWNPREIFGFEGFTTITKTHVDHSWCGDVLEVLEINVPYIVVRKLSQYSSKGNTVFNLDLRLCNIMELTKEFVDAYLSERKD